MATQIDTGLGWSADSDYLVSLAPALLGTKTVFESSSLALVPEGSTAADLKLIDFWYRTSGGHYCIMADPGVKMYAFLVGKSLVYVCENQTGSGNVGQYGYWQGASTLVIYGGLAATQLDSVTGLYYGLITSPQTANMNPALPSFSSVSEGLATISSSNLPYYKLNAGYAVACIAEWYTPEGTDLIAPVLISNVANYTAISKDGTTPASDMTTFDFLYNGMRFYMSLIGGNSDPISTTLEYADLRQFAAAAPSKVFRLLASASFANILVLDAPDPYDESAEEEGGNGEEPEDDPVEEETMPLPSVAGLGFCSIYVPSQSELLAMSAYLWNGSFDVSQVIKLFSNPMDSIIGLSAVPVDLVGTSEQIYLGGVALTGITMPRYNGRTAVKVDMGTATIEKRYGAYLDYDPYTEFSIYVPFVGIKNLKADDIMGKTVSLMYDIDILTGACVAYLRPVGGSVLYEWAGQCAQQIPITGSNWDNIFRNAMAAATTLGGALIAPASAPVLAGAVASAAVQSVATKPTIERSGSLTGVSGWLGQLRPYIIRTTPEAYIPADQNKFIGYPAYINVSMGDIVGYNEVSSLHLENIPATGDELAEIETLLKGGAIF